jgi:hypothetical protein
MPAVVLPRNPRTTPAALRPPQHNLQRPRDPGHVRYLSFLEASSEPAEARPSRRVGRMGGHRMFVSWCFTAPPHTAQLGGSLFGFGDSACLCFGRAHYVLSPPPQSTTEEARPLMAHYPDQEYHKHGCLVSQQHARRPLSASSSHRLLHLVHRRHRCATPDVDVTRCLDGGPQRAGPR